MKNILQHIKIYLLYKIKLDKENKYADTHFDIYSKQKSQ